MNLLSVVIIGVLGLLGVGLYALLITRNLIKIVVALQILVKAILLAIIMAGKVQGNMALAQSMALTVIVADTIVAVLGLALAVQIRRQLGTLDVQALSTLRR
ncbi:MAG TPA: NADH-quinone oxidoreductase subunit K [Anaerolineaceae bacterium]|nr:NADH-quinone oxidoreductase subunit K [Anaerolineaceae bacterium]